MTENKPIIIDGVDVSVCKHFKNRTCLADYLLTDMTFSEAKCELCKDCYFKRLARKTQAEERLVQQIQTICDFINNRPEIFKGIYGDVDKIITDYAECKEQECENWQKELDKTHLLMLEKQDELVKEILKNDQLKAEKKQAEQKLERIKKICIKNSTKSSFCNGFENKDMQKLAIRILQIISEVLNE